jgi:TP901 family phage tail tape measure protein
MPDNRQEFTIDAEQALQTLAKLKTAFSQNNASLGQIVDVFQRVNKEGRVTSTTFTQVSETGQAVITTIRGLNDNYKVLSQRTKDATEAQKQAASAFAETTRIRGYIAELQKYATLLQQISRSPTVLPTIPSGGGAGGGGTPPPASGAAAAPSPGGPPVNLAAVAQMNALYQQGIIRLAQINTGLVAASQNAQILHGVTQSVTRTFDTLGRIALFQVLHRSFGAIIQDMQEAIHSAGEFERQLGLIRTISQDSGNTLEQFRDEIVSIANEFGRPIDEVVKAAYQGISNQVIQSTKDFELLRQAVAFSRVTNATAVESIDLFSSAINSFGFTAQDADRIASVFFKTIDLGRITAKDFSHQFGIIGPLAQQVGLSFEETNAAIAKISQSGTDSSISLTLAANALKAFIKPSKDLTELIKELGFATGEELIAAKGFEGALDAVITKAHGSSTELAKLVADFRELRGFTALSAEGVKTFADNLSEIKDASGGFNEALKEMRANAGQRFQDELNKIKTFFTTEFGGSILNAVTNLTSQFGGLANTARTLTGVVVALGVAVSAAFLASKIITFVTYVRNAIVAFQALYTGTKALEVALYSLGIQATGTSALLTGGLTAVIGIVAFLAIRSHAAAEEMRVAFKQTLESIKHDYEEITKSAKSEIDKQTAEFVGSQKKQQAAFLNTVSIIQKGLNDITLANKSAMKQLVEDLKNAFDEVEGSLKHNISNITKAEKDARSEVEKAYKDNIDAQEKASKDHFEAELDRLEKNLAANQRANTRLESQFDHRQQLITKALNAQAALERAGEAGNLGRGSSKAFEQARKDAEAAQHALAKGPRASEGDRVVSGNAATVIGQLVAARNELLVQRAVDLINLGNIEKARQLLNEAEQNLNTLAQKGFNVDAARNELLRQRHDINNQIAKVQAEEAERLRKLKQEEEDRLRKVQDLFKQIAAFQAINKEGKLLPQFKTPQEALDALAKLQDELVKVLGSAQVLNNPGLLKDFGEGLATLKDRLTGQGKGLANQLNAQAIQNQVNALKDRYGEFSKAASAVNDKFAAEMKNNLDLIGKLRAESEALTAVLGPGLKGAVDPLTGALAQAIGSLGIGPQGEGAIQKLIREAQELQRSGDLDGAAAKINAIRDALAKLNKETNFGDFLKAPVIAPDKTGKGGADVGQTLDQIVRNLERIKGLQSYNQDIQAQIEANQRNFEVVARGLTNTADQLIPSIQKVRNAASDLGSIAPPAIEGVTSALGRVGEKADSVRGQIDALRKAIESLPALPSGAVGGARAAAEGAFRGGLIGMAGGGFLSDFFSGKYARGVDTRPVMARPGEYFVKPEAAARFLPQLVAMNNFKPEYKSGGGSVSVGDVHVHVEGGNTQGQSIANIGRGLQRAIRLGTVKLS